MTSAIHGYAIHWPNVEHFLAQRGAAPEAQRFQWLEPHLDRLDHEFERMIQRGAPTAREALGALMLGAPLRPGSGFMYAYVLQVVVEIEGAVLDNGPLVVTNSGFFGAVDRALADRGMTRPLFEGMIIGQLPIAIPAIDGHPGLGYLDAAQMPALGAELQALNLDGLDPTIVAATRAVTQWVLDAADFGNSIATFYY